MSAQAVLFDIPGPKARARNLAVGLIGGLLVLSGIASVLWGLRAQLTPDKFAPFLDPITWTAYIWPGLFMTIQAALVSVVAATILGLLLGMGRLSNNRPVRWLTSAFVEFFRSVPVLMMMIFAYFLFLYTHVLTGDMLSLAGVVMGLTLYNSCVMAELIRSGVHGLPKGQSEAGYAIGLSRGQTLRSILLPQAVTAMLPSLVSQLVVILKDTALGYIISYPELLRSAQTLDASKGNLIASFMVVAVIFILINYGLTQVAHLLERRLSGRRAGPRAVALANLATNPDPELELYTDTNRFEQRDPAEATRGHRPRED